MAHGTAEGKLGLWMSTSLVIGNMIGAGIYLMPAALATFGGISILGWIASGVGALILARIFSRLSVMVRNKNGGPYAYTREAFGDFIGFLIAWGYWISTWVSNAAIAIAFISALSVLFPALAEPVWAILTGLAAIWILSWVNSRGIRASGKMQVATTILKLTPIAVIILGGFFFFDPGNFLPFNASTNTGFGAVAITATMTLYAFLGIESATIPAENVAMPEKTIPRATMLGTGITTAVYILSTIMVMGMVPLDQLAGSPAPFADAMGVMTGDWGRDLIAAGAAISAFGALNGWILIVGQVPMATAEDRLFPGIFKKRNKHGIPAFGIAIGGLMSSAVMLMNYTKGFVEQFRFLIVLTTLCVLVPYLFCAAAYVMLKVRQQLDVHMWWPILILGTAGFAFSLWAIYGAGQEAVFWGFILLLAGIPFYLWIRWKNRNI